MHFGWWVPLQQSIPLKKAVETGLLRGHPQRMLKIDYAKFEQGLRQGGIEW
jgi:hypothetical protein